MNQTDIRDAATSAANTTKSFLGNQVDQRSTDLGRAITNTADDLRKVGDQLRSSAPGGAGAAVFADRAADYVQRFGQYLQDADGERLVADLESFSRQRPWAIATGALLLGFTTSRVLKASSARRYYREYTPYEGYSAGGTSQSGTYAGSITGESSYGTSGTPRGTYGSSVGTGGSSYGSSGGGSSYGSSGGGSSFGTPTSGLNSDFGTGNSGRTTDDA
ncbi:MAG: hypothetical protein ABR591_11415 [Candidatus Velthaea sp.]